MTQNKQPSPRTRRTSRNASQGASPGSRDYVRAVLDGLSSHIAIVDGNGIIETVNRAWRMFAEENPPVRGNVCEGADYLATCDTAIGSDSDIARSAAEGIRGVLQGQTARFTIEYPCHSPEVQRWFALRVTPLPGPGPVRAIVAHENITERRQAEDAVQEAHRALERRVEERTAELASANRALEAEIARRQSVEDSLRLSEERYRIVAEFTYDWEYWEAPDGTLEYISPSCERVTGYSATEFRSNPALIRSLAHPDDPGRLANHRHAVPSGADEEDYHELVFPILTKNGGKCWISHICRKVYNSDGVYLGRRACNRDITERELALEKLVDSERLFRQLADNIHELFFLVAAGSGDLLYASPAVESILGVARDRLPANIDVLFAGIVERDRQRLGITTRWILREWGLDEEFQILRPDGETRWLRLRTFPIRDERQALYRVAGIAADVSGHKQAAEKEQEHARQLQQADKMASLGVLVAGVAHEINNPNNFIMLSGPILRQVWEDVRPILDEYYAANGDFKMGGINFSRMSTRVPKLHDGIENGSRRIQRIVADLKNYARLDAYGYDQPVDVNQVVRDAVSLMETLVARSTDRFSFVPAPKQVRILGNGQRLEQVIINLIQNGCEALGSRDSALEIRVTVAAEGCVVCVRDEGKGIPASEMSRLTDPFYTTKRESGGTGLGLAVSAGIVKEHGGRLEFESEVGKGTTVRVVLPLQKTRNVVT